MRRSLVFLLTLSAIAIGATLLSGAPQEEPFPHDRHQGLFPLCQGCHEGIPSGDPADWYPEPAACAQCHDGVERERVAWSGPSERVDNVDFDHPTHESEMVAAGDTTRACAACHIPEGAGRLEVANELQLGTCWGCHAHATDDHFTVEASCETCHIPLASTAFDRARIESLPMPSSHEAPDFVLDVHGSLAPGNTEQCATCHTRERCVSCHVDSGLDPIQAVPEAPSTMELPPAQAEYPEPPSHQSEDWLEAHQRDAAVAECSTCHTGNDCRVCHVASVPDLVASLPRREDVVAPGVMLESRSPDSHASLFFMQAHPVLASADQVTCQTCHVDRFCVQCHEADVGGGYHPADFMVRHAGDAYGRDSECATCHEPRVFCRQCHEDLGLAGPRQVSEGYHDASPLWLLQHGQAARQNLESCSSCHRQVDCTRCHSTIGAFQVSPHTADFDAERAWQRSARTCLACHIGNPLNGNEP